MGKKNLLPGPGSLSVWRLHIPPMSAWVFSGSFGFLPHPNDLMLGEMACPTCPSLSVGVRVMHPEIEGHPVHGGYPPCALSCRDRLWPLMTVNWNKRVGQ